MPASQVYDFATVCHAVDLEPAQRAHHRGAFDGRSWCRRAWPRARKRAARGGPPERAVEAAQAVVLASSCCNSPDSYISRMMSAPPTNSPLT